MPRDAWMGGAAREAPDPVPWLRGAAFETRIPVAEFMTAAEGNGTVSVGSFPRTRTMADGNRARGACSLRRNCTRIEGNRAGDTGSLRRYCTVRICDRRVGARGLEIEATCVALLDRLAAGKQASCETEVPRTVLPAGGSGVPHRRRIVICRCGKCQDGARSGFPPRCGQHLGARRG